VAAIKIDVEGAELDVLQGLERTVRQNQPYIFCEVLPVWDERTDIGRFRLGRQTTLRTMLHDLGYGIFRIYFDASVEPLDDFGVHGDLTMSNYVFVPREQLPAFRCLFAVGQATESTRIAGPADART